MEKGLERSFRSMGGVYKINEPPHLVYWDSEGGKFLPGVAKSWDVSDDGKIYIFHLREGMKWSDGHPYSADDLIFGQTT